MMFWKDYKYIVLWITNKCLQSYKKGQVSVIESKCLCYIIIVVFISCFIHWIPIENILFDNKWCIFVMLTLFLTIVVICSDIEWYYLTHSISKNVNKGIS